MPASFEGHTFYRWESGGEKVMLPVIRQEVSGRLGHRPRPPSRCQHWSLSPPQQRGPGAGLCSFPGNNILSHCRVSFRSSNAVLLSSWEFLLPSEEKALIPRSLPPSLPSPGHLGSFDLFCKGSPTRNFQFFSSDPRHSHLNIALCWGCK